MGELTVVTGGARSGKSTFAQGLAERAGKSVVYLATLEPRDSEMEHRVRLHRERRPSHWRTIEESLDVARELRSLREFDGIVILECLTLLATNLMLHRMEGQDADDGALEELVLRQVDALVESAASGVFHLIVVTNEVGLGIVPDSRLGRLFRDIAGFANQRVAAAASSVYFVVSGIPLKIKGQEV